MEDHPKNVKGLIEKSRIRETPTLTTNADWSTDTINNLFSHSCYFMSFEIEDFLPFLAAAVQWLKSCGRSCSIVERPRPWNNERPGNWSCHRCWPKRGLKKLHGKGTRWGRTLHLLDQLRPEGPSWWKSRIKKTLNLPTYADGHFYHSFICGFVIIIIIIIRQEFSATCRVKMHSLAW